MRIGEPTNWNPCALCGYEEKPRFFIDQYSGISAFCDKCGAETKSFETWEEALYAYNRGEVTPDEEWQKA